MYGEGPVFKGIINGIINGKSTHHGGMIMHPRNEENSPDLSEMETSDSLKYSLSYVALWWLPNGILPLCHG